MKVPAAVGEVLKREGVECLIGYPALLEFVSGQEIEYSIFA